MLEPYQAIGLVPTMRGIRRRADISVNSFKCPSAGSSENCPTLVGTVMTNGMAVTAVEVRDAARGQNGPVIVRLVKVDDDTWQVPSGTILTDAQYADYWAGRLYVNVDSEAFQCARRYMIRLEPTDFADSKKVASLAALTTLTPEQFRDRFEKIARI